MVLRGGMVNPKIKDRPTPELLLELWGFEASPYAPNCTRRFE